MARKSKTKKKEQAPELSELEADLTALLNHFLPDADIDEMVGDLATKKDGTVVYVGDVTLPSSDPDDDPDDDDEDVDADEDESDDEIDDDEGDDEGDDDEKKTPAKTRPPVGRNKRRPASKADKTKTKPGYNPVPTAFGDNRTSL